MALEDMNIWIVRYGLTKYPLVENKGPFDSPIDPVDGVEHASAIASRFKMASNKPSVVYASPFLRTAETAHFIATACGCKVKIEEGLTEWQTPSLIVDEHGKRTHPLSTEDLAERFDTIDPSYKSLNPTGTSPGSPTFPENEEQLLLRCATTTKKILADANSVPSVAIVSHAPCDQAIAYFLEGVSTPEESILTPWPLGGITLFTGNKLETYGDTSHMPGKYQPGIKKWSLPCLTK